MSFSSLAPAIDFQPPYLVRRADELIPNHSTGFHANTARWEALDRSRRSLNGDEDGRLKHRPSAN
jgi:hypothetical protein